MTTTTNIYDFIGEICTTLGYNYQHGSFKAIQKYLLISLGNKEPMANRFPLVALITQDMIVDAESNGSFEDGYPLRLLIANYTKANYSENERIEVNFKLVLWPMYNAIMDALRNYSKNEFRALPHRKQDHFYYSVDANKTANVLGFTLDAVEITDLKIEINFRENECIN